MAAQEELKNIRVFSKKLNSTIDVFPSKERNKLHTLYPNWLNNGWSNYPYTWINKGWSDFPNEWMNKGWNDFPTTWIDGGWNDFLTTWINNGWTDSIFFDKKQKPVSVSLENANYSEKIKLVRMHIEKLASSDPEFRKQVYEYYKAAPNIVKALSSNPDKDQVLDNIYSDMFLPGLELLEKGETEEAKKFFAGKYSNLKSNYSTEIQKKLRRRS